AIDVAKIIGVASTNRESIREFQGYYRIPNPGPPLVAMPTTAGTGSEATKVAVITDTARNVKMMILDSKLMPAAAIVDYELTLSMPKPLTAHVGVDTLTHGIEAYVSRKANALTDTLDRLNRELQVPRLRDCCGGDFEAFRAVLPKMASDALESGSPQNNPIIPSNGQIIELYEAAW